MPKARIPLVLAGLSAAAGAVFVGVGCALSAPRFHGPKSDHFDGKRFRSAEPRPEHGTGALLRWLTHRDRGPWSHWVDASPGPRPPERVAGGALRVTFVNHSTVLVQMVFGVIVCAIAGLVYLRSPAIAESDREILGGLMRGKEARILKLVGLVRS